MTKHNKRLPHPRATWFSPETGALIEHASLMQRMAEKDVVLLGETHNVAEIHRWQLHVAAALHLLRPDMMMGFEMFPARLQPVLDDWVEGKFDTETFLRESEWYEVWGFPAELYLPLFHFCRQHRIRMLALNCYRALVTRVGVEGWENVPESERDGLTPAAPARAEYHLYLKKIVGSFGDSGRAEGAPRARVMDSDRFIRAQQTWDRAFACNIARAWRESASKPLIIGIIGRGHLEYGHGTPFQLKDLGIEKTAVLLPSESDEIDPDEIKGIGDALFRLDTPEPPVARRISYPSRPERPSVDAAR